MGWINNLKVAYKMLILTAIAVVGMSFIDSVKLIV